MTPELINELVSQLQASTETIRGAALYNRVEPPEVVNRLYALVKANEATIAKVGTVMLADGMVKPDDPFI